MRLCLSVSMVIMMAASIDASAAVGIDAYKGKDPIGGGPGYTQHVDAAKAEYLVSTLTELKEALGKAVSGEIVYVADGAEIDATGERSIVIPGGVTLAGNRGKDGAPGPLIKATLLELEADEESKAAIARAGRGSYCWQLFVVGGPNVRVTGLRIQGPDTSIRTEAYETTNCDAIRCNYPELEVDNCELWGWSHAAIGIYAGQGHHIHHSYIHHCRRKGLGYGVSLGESQAMIECNHFVDNRHDIAGTGRAGTSYWARYNISEAIDPPVSHAFDMHGNHESRRDGKEWPMFAGDSIVICYNTFKSRDPRDYITIRGDPRAGGTIYHNLYERARYGARGWEACKSLTIYNDVFLAKPSIAYYRFDTAGNNLNGKRMPAGQVTELPGKELP